MILSFIEQPVTENVSKEVSFTDMVVTDSSDRIISNLEFISQKENTSRPLEEVTFSEKKETSYEEKYKMILVQIEKERFERELIAGSR